MIRRTVLRSALAAGIVVIAPMAADAQQAKKVYRIGWLSPTEGPRPMFRETLRELGWIEGKTIAFEVRTADGQRELLPALAEDLVRTNVDIIVAVAPGAIRAAKQNTTKIPIVMAWWGGPDLVESGLIASFARPGGNSGPRSSVRYRMHAPRQRDGRRHARADGREATQRSSFARLCCRWNDTPTRRTTTSSC